MKVFAMLVSAGLGLWIGSKHFFPEWAHWALVVFACGVWCVGEFLERREGDDDDAC